MTGLGPTPNNVNRPGVNPGESSILHRRELLVKEKFPDYVPPETPTVSPKKKTRVTDLRNRV